MNSHSVSPCPVKDIRPMWCSNEMKKSYTLNNVNKTGFCEKLYLFNFCQNRIQSQKDLV